MGSKDITNLLAGWDFHPEEIRVRIIETEAGEERIQLRLEMGLLQMVLSGRPDGRQIKEHPSLLDLHQQKQKEHDKANPDGVPFQLTSEDCAELLREGVQYYHRYLSFWHLQRFELCARDTQRNLELFKFVRNHAKSEQDKMLFDQWRPYVTMMHTRAVATPFVQLEEWEVAAQVIDAGIEGIRRFLQDYGKEELEDNIGELAFLRRWRKEIIKLGDLDEETEETDPLVELNQELEKAIEKERYLEAAKIRDKIKRLENPPPPESGWASDL